MFAVSNYDSGTVNTETRRFHLFSSSFTEHGRQRFNGLARKIYRKFTNDSGEIRNAPGSAVDGCWSLSVPCYRNVLLFQLSGLC